MVFPSMGPPKFNAPLCCCHGISTTGFPYANPNSKHLPALHPVPRPPPEAPPGCSLLSGRKTYGPGVMLEWPGVASRRCEGTSLGRRRCCLLEHGLLAATVAADGPIS